MAADRPAGISRETEPGPAEMASAASCWESQNADRSLGALLTFDHRNSDVTRISRGVPLGFASQTMLFFQRGRLAGAFWRDLVRPARPIFGVVGANAGGTLPAGNGICRPGSRVNRPNFPG